MGQNGSVGASSSFPLYPHKADINCRNCDVRFVPIVLQKSQKTQRHIFRQGRDKQKFPINASSNPLPESPVSLSHGRVVPHVIIRSSHLWLGEFESHAAKDFCNTIRQERTSEDCRRMSAECQKRAHSVTSYERVNGAGLTDDKEKRRRLHPVPWPAGGTTYNVSAKTA
jgi:hypothetical protein